MPARRCLPAALAVLAAVLAPAAHAADLQVAPISLQYGPSELAQGIWLSNTGQQPLRAQIRVQRWTQASATDLLEPAADVVASPPGVVIAPGQRQLVRIVRRNPVAPARELSYRIIIDELPAPAGQPEPAPSASGGLRFLLRYSLPMFVSPAEVAPSPRTDLSALQARIEPGEPPALTVVNHGPRRVRISQLAHEASNGDRTALVPGLLGYVLAGQQMRWPLPPTSRSLADGTLKARFNDDMHEQAVPLRPGAE